MSSDSSTLSSHSVVLCWLKDNPHSPFPMREFTKAVGHDLQGSQVLQQHIAHIKPFWKHGLPSTHRRRHQLYVEDLQPRLSKDLKRVERLILFVNAEVQVFCARPSHWALHDNSITLDLLKQLRLALQQLLDQINRLPKDGPASLQDTPREEPQRRRNPSQNRDALRHEESRKAAPKKQVRFAGVQRAQKISLIKPTHAPAIVTQFRTVRCDCDQSLCRCPDKTPSPIVRVDSALSIR